MLSWTDERIELLKKLWMDGLSASQIATQLGGVTRNAIIGKVHRLNLSGRAKPATLAPRPRKSRPAPPPHRPAAPRYNPPGLGMKIHAHPAPQPIPNQTFERKLMGPLSMRVSFMNLNDQTCKWPVGDPILDKKNFHFCGHKPFGKMPYCEYHSWLAYQPVTHRRRTRHEGAGGHAEALPA